MPRPKPILTVRVGDAVMKVYDRDAAAVVIQQFMKGEVGAISAVGAVGAVKMDKCDKHVESGESDKVDKSDRSRKVELESKAQLEQLERLERKERLEPKEQKGEFIETVAATLLPWLGTYVDVREEGESIVVYKRSRIPEREWVKISSCVKQLGGSFEPSRDAWIIPKPKPEVKGGGQ